MKLFNRVSRRIRSRGRKRPALHLNFELCEDRVLLTNYLVNNAADSNTGTGNTGTLRYVLNLLPDTATATNEIDFNIPGPGPFIIQPLTALPPITDQVNLDGTTERTFLGLPATGPPVIQLNGNGLPDDGLVLGSTPAGESVSGTSSAGSTIIGLNIYNFTGGAGIHIQTNDNLVTGNFLGTDVNGTAAGPGNGTGVVIDSGASNNTIGGTGAGAGNVISGNSGDGIDIGSFSPTLSSGNGNLVQGNKIGTNAAGTAELTNAAGTAEMGNGSAGVRFVDGMSNTVENNVISGNVNEGIFFHGNDGASDEMVLGNLVGTNAAGTAPIGNGLSGITLQQSVANTIGGNVISGNGVGPFGGNGITLAGGSNNAVLGNFIGTNAAGTAALGNTDAGVFIEASNNTIGGANTIGFNTDGIEITGSGATGNVVQGNYIGTNASGAKLGNGDGVLISDAPSNTISGANTIGFNTDGIDFEAGATGNVVQGNYIGTNAGGANLGNGDGVLISDVPSNTISGANTIGFNTDGIDFEAGATGNVVQGNYIGTNASGANLGNGDGVLISDAPSNTIGGANTIGFNTDGIQITGSGATGNMVQGNYIGTNASGANLGNVGDGVLIDNLASNNTIGGANTIGRNGTGIDFESGATGNEVLGNFIGTDPTGTVGRGNTLDGISLNDASSNRIIGNVVSGNGINQDAAGINLESNDRNNIIAGNKIGTNAAGTAALGNSLHGIFLGNGSSNNTIGGTAAGAGNVISGNGKFPVPVADFATQGGVGVYIFGSGATDNMVLGNFIGTNASGTAALDNSVIGVLINQSPGNTVRGNLISGNRFIGLEIAGGTASGNLVQSNKIGTNAVGTAAIPNGTAAIPGDGIFINNAPNNTIGGTAAGAGNLISGNTFVGIELFGRLTSKNVIQGNKIGTDATGRLTLPNKVGGIFVITPSANQIGGTGPGQANQGQNIPIFGMPGLADPGSTSSVAARRRSRRGKATPMRTRAVVPSHPSGPSAHIPHHWSPSGGKKRSPHRV